MHHTDRAPVNGLIFDPFAGISGDMILGSLIDLGLEADWLRDFVAELGLGDVEVVIERAMRCGVDCGRVHFELPHEHAHRHLSDVLEIVDRSTASPTVKSRAADVFRRLAEAEASVHGTEIEEVHFHEVGALDAILDVLCGVAAIEELGIERCYTRPVTIGTGFIDIAHGRFPLPAPATVRLLSGYAVRDAGFAGECTTPTGAAMLATLCEGRRAPAEFTVRRTGYGAGTRDPKGHPNCLRVIACDVGAGQEDRLFMVQADVDDLPPEYAVPARDAVLEAGALDAVLSPLGMKKGRSGLRLEALVPESRLEAASRALFLGTSTIGVRYWPIERSVLPRSEEVVEWRGHSIRRKRVRLPDGSERTKPEYDDVLAAARELRLSPYEVRQAVDRIPMHGKNAIQ